MLRVISFVLWLGPVVLRGSGFIRFILRLLRRFFLLFFSVVIVLSIFWFFHPYIPSKGSLEAQAIGVNDALTALSDKLKDNEIDPSKLRFKVEPLNPSLPKERYYKLKMIFDESISRDLLTISPALYKLPVVPWIAKRSWWPIREIEFNSGLYVGSAILAENAEAELSTSDIETVRRIIDPVIEQLPSAKSSELAAARRLVGTIQIVCYVLAVYGGLQILFTWFATLLPNAILRATGRVNLVEITADRMKVSDDRYAWRLRRRDAAPYPSADVPGDDVPSPWLHDAPVQATAADYERFYSELGIQTASQAGGWLAKPLIPLTELRRVGYMALYNSPGGETVPGFVSVESDAIYENFAAENKHVEYLIWAIPTLGFVGTVLGIGTALSATINIESSVLSTQTEAANLVGANIGVAFDTTFVALILSFVLMFLYYALQASQERMIAFEKRAALAEIIQPENIVVSVASGEVDLKLEEIKRQIGRLRHRAYSTKESTARMRRKIVSHPDTRNRPREKKQSYVGRLFFVIILSALLVLIYYVLELDLTSIFKQFSKWAANLL